MASSLFLSLLAGAFLALVDARAYSPALPIIDLGYERHQAISFNQTANYYNFSNIRYAAPPVGNLRFAAPQAPERNRGAVQTGNVGKICPQANPSWSGVQSVFLADYLSGRPFNATAANASAAAAPPATVDPRSTEDCLFLDVFVPEKVFNAKGRSKGAAVLVWIYGGGYTAGQKASSTPNGLLQRGNESVIYVALNYRLGALGWSSGPTFQADGVANAGLYDQRFALEWVQKNIHLFGGDKSKVTVFGESAGGGSVMHQITAYGGIKGKAPFAGAIPQSPGFIPVVSLSKEEDTFNTFLSLLNVSTLAEARQLPSDVVIAANRQQVRNSPYGQFTYGPVVDGDFVPALPGQLLLHGQFDRSVRILTGHNADEGLLFTSPFVQADAQFKQSLEDSFPGIPASSVNYITETLYPPVYDGSNGYTDATQRLALINSEQSFTCNDNYLARAYGNKTYAYWFTIPPALHGQDVAYTYYDDTGVSATIQNATVARVLQEFITSFAINGRPSSSTWGQAIPQYGSEANIVNLNRTSITVQKDDTANPRCLWWQKGLLN